MSAERDLRQAPLPERPTRHQVLELARSNAAVYAFMNLWHRGDWTWEEALAGAVVHLSEENRRLVEAEIQQARLHGGRYVL